MIWLTYKKKVATINVGTEEDPKMEDVLQDMGLQYSEANKEIAKREAYNGEYTIEDDGQPEPITPTNEDVNWDAMAEAIKEGVNEV